MKIVVFSDNHRDREVVERILLLNPDADRVLSLGDSEMREDELSALGVYGVKGNYPFEPDFPDELTTVFEGWKTFIAHGHRYGVKNGLYWLSERARAEECDIAMFGHTHAPFLEERDGVVFLNPGSAARPRNGLAGTYAVIEAFEPELKIAILDVDTNKPLNTLSKRKGRTPSWR
ncbi:MAG: metallophosphoesterase [Bacillota bacterium]|nr:metallophosphoesterase [Bacillota bacterium]